MSYPASLLQQQIRRRLAGECRLNLRGQSAVTYAGERLTQHTSCADCRESCETHSATGLVPGALNIEIDARCSDPLLRWTCPGCGHPVSESTSLLTAQRDAVGIAADPLCFSCRKRAIR